MGWALGALPALAGRFPSAPLRTRRAPFVVHRALHRLDREAWGLLPPEAEPPHADTDHLEVWHALEVARDSGLITDELLILGRNATFLRNKYNYNISLAFPQEVDARCKKVLRYSLLAHHEENVKFWAGLGRASATKLYGGLYIKL